MASTRSTFRPSIQSLESRRCLAASALVGGELLDPTHDQGGETAPLATIVGSTISGNTASQNGGGIAPYPGFTGGVRVAVGDINTDGKADIVVSVDTGGGPHVKVFGATTVQPANTIVVGEKQIAPRDNEATDAFFRELGDGTDGNAASNEILISQDDQNVNLNVD